jgi:hypothetical protein
MTSFRKTRYKAEFGDFQTPGELCRHICGLLCRRGVRPRSILEPNCGTGNFIAAALEVFPSVERAVGVEINPAHVAAAHSMFAASKCRAQIEVVQADFFSADWAGILQKLPDPLLVLGNPPWVTNAAVGTMRGSNLPQKSNTPRARGIEAITGKSNFDISEWMICRELEWIEDRNAVLAMLCKTAVARRACARTWQNGRFMKGADLYRVDASRYFGVAVDACLLVTAVSGGRRDFDCRVHAELQESRSYNVFGCRNGRLIADPECYERTRFLEGESPHVWRSGIKHDCSKVMVLEEVENGYRNGLGECADLETECLYPMLKSAEIADPAGFNPRRLMLVTQKSTGDDPGTVQFRAPKTWAYLMAHADLLDRRGSSVYRNRPRFSIFGVGDYAFAPWKVAISGLHKSLHFKVVGPFKGKPVVLDDTSYFLACHTREEAEFLAGLLNSDLAKDFFSATIFWDAKRPITAAILQRLDLIALAKKLSEEHN